MNTNRFATNNIMLFRCKL